MPSSSTPAEAAQVPAVTTAIADPASAGGVELHRHRCLVRQCIRWRLQHGREWLRAWLDGFRGDRAALMADVAAQWAAGNQGARGEWMEAAA